MLRADRLEAGYGASRVLFGLSFDAPPGQVVSLIGRNGMGKTTTIRTIMGMLPLQSGTITFDGQSIAGLAPNAIARRGIGLVPEGRRVFGSLTVQENLLATARGKERGWTLERAFALFPRLGERKGQFARSLSGGEQQMLAVGRALLTNPRLLVLDEATEGLAPVIRAEIWSCLAELKRAGQTILVVDKNLQEMAPLVDRHHVVEKGKIVWAGSPEALRREPDLAHRYLGI